MKLEAPATMGRFRLEEVDEEGGRLTEAGGAESPLVPGCRRGWLLDLDLELEVVLVF